MSSRMSASLRNQLKFVGAGKGDVNGWFAVVEPGTIRMEIGGIPEADCKEALHQAGYKLSVQSRIVKKGEENK